MLLIEQSSADLPEIGIRHWDLMCGRIVAGNLFGEGSRSEGRRDEM